MTELRLFIAIPLDNSLRAELEQLEERLQVRLNSHSVPQKSIRWVAPQNIHLTLRFLGNVNRAKLPDLEAAINRSAHGLPHFELAARGLGCFPNVTRPNNIWVGLDGDLKTASLLVRNLENELVGLGFPRDQRGFEPHMTLGRVKREATRAVRIRIGEVISSFPATVFGTLCAESVHLIASDLRPAGPVYTSIASIPF
jgi:2'-5' RNA ligase